MEHHKLELFKYLENAKLFCNQNFQQLIETYMIKKDVIPGPLNTKNLYKLIMEKFSYLFNYQFKPKSFFSDLFEIINMITGCLLDIEKSSTYYSSISIEQFCMNNTQVLTYSDALRKIRAFIGMIFVQLFLILEYMKEKLTQSIIENNIEMTQGILQCYYMQDFYSLIFMNNFNSFFSCLKEEDKITSYANSINSDQLIYQFASFIAAVSKYLQTDNPMVLAENEMIMLPILMSYENNYYNRREHKDFLEKSVDILFTQMNFNEPPSEWIIYKVMRVFHSIYNINFDFLKDFEDLLFTKIENAGTSSFIRKKDSIRRNYQGDMEVAEVETRKLQILVKFLQTFSWTNTKRQGEVIYKFISVIEEIKRMKYNLEKSYHEEMNKRRDPSAYNRNKFMI